MNSDLCLYCAGVLLSFSLQVTAAYIACGLVTRTLTRPRHRFRVWLVFLSGSVLYWAGLVAWQLRVYNRKDLVANASSSLPAGAPNSFFLLPSSWSTGVLLAGRVLGIAYLAVVILLLAVAVWRQVQLWMLLRHARAAARPVSELFQGIRNELGVRRCALLVLPGLGSPATVGWIRPRILLPAVCEELGTNSRLADVIHHELAHVARRDYFWASVSDIICRILFFHPALWRARTLARFQGELACDLDVVEGRPEHRVDYADSLAYFVRLRMLEEREAVGLDFAAPSSLGKRIRFILAGPPSLPWWKRIPRRAAALTITAVFVLAAPALTVSFSFLQPLSQSLASAPVSASTSSDHTLRSGSHRESKSLLPAVTDLSKLRVEGSSPGDSEYAFTRSDGRGASRSSDMERPWRESERSSQPSVASIIRSGVLIAASRTDHDHEREPHTTH